MRGMGGTNLADPSAALLATCGGDTVKLFDLTMESGDPCALSYSPTSGSHVNSVKWNHTNLVVASAGEDKKITLWRKNGQSVGTVPLADGDAGDNISESINAISFSNKGSRYLCSGGSSHIVRVWDLQRKRCIKWLSGHTDTVTGVMYNCKDEHLASISVKGDIIIHNLAHGSRAAELRDPDGQALRVLDYSRLSRHILATAGDDGSVHLWDTTGRSPKMSWLKVHSAPTAGVCCSPSNDKLIASVGLDKKLYMLDSANRRPVSCTPHEAPFSSLAFRDDGFILSAGTNTGRIVFYDIRGKPQPLTLLRAYNSSEAVTSLCWQRSKTVAVNENCSSEIALLGSAGEDSVLMPDPLPSTSTSTTSSSSSSSSNEIASPGRGLSSLSAQEAVPFRSQTWTSGSLLKLHAPRNSVNLKDDMEIFSPLVDVQPITPSIGNWWDEKDEVMKDGPAVEKKSTFLSSSFRMTPCPEGNLGSHPVPDWKSSLSTFAQEDAGTNNFYQSGESSVSTNGLVDKLARHQPISLSRFMPSSSMGSSDSSTLSFKSSLAGPSFSSSNVLKNPATALESTASQLGPAKTLPTPVDIGLPGSSSSSLSSLLSRRYPISIDSSPKARKSGADNRDEVKSSSLMEQETLSVGVHPTEQLQGSSPFSLQLIQRTLEESLGSLQLSIHEDVRNLHIELIRQFHMQEVEMGGLMSSVLEKLDDLQKEVQNLRRENQQLRMLL